MAVMRTVVPRLVRLTAGAAACAALASAADQVVVLSSGSFSAPLEVAAPWFERRTGHDVVTVLAAAPDAARDSLPARLASDERADVVIGATRTLDALIAAGEVERGSRRDLAARREGGRVSSISAGVAAGAASAGAARALVEFLAAPALGPVVERFGLEQAGIDAGDWRPLFNGRDLSNWTPKIRGFALGENFANTFRVRDGVLAVAYDGYESFADRFGHLFFAEPFSRYRLRIEYRFVGQQAPAAPDWAARNSGVMVHSQAPETMLLDQDFPISLEVQFLGGLSDGNARSTGNVCTPGTRIVYEGAPDTSHCIRSTSPTIDGDAWVAADVLVEGSERVVHYIDGLPVVEYGGVTYGGGNVAGHDPAAKPDGERLERGYLSLQSESHPIEFRRVELLSLEGR